MKRSTTPTVLPTTLLLIHFQRAFEMENDPFDLRLLLKTPLSDMWVDAAAKGKIDLSKNVQGW